MSETEIDDERVVATVEILDECTDEEEMEIISRLDDGNNYPGFITRRDGNTLAVCVED